ncbi:RNA-guided endonuclease InsQ/TnpB family protein [Streptomyces sp. NPDC003343]
MRTERAWEKRQFGHRARSALVPAQARLIDVQAHAARTTWNLLHDFWTMTPKCRRSLKVADEAIRQARKEIDWLGVLPAQAAQAVLKTYHQAWKNCWEGRAGEPTFKTRTRSVMSVDIPQGRDLQIKRVHRRWGMVNIPKVGRVRFRWTRDLPVGKKASEDHRITGARLVKDALGWHITFRVQTLVPPSGPHIGAEVGIDVGVNVPLALSDGNHQDHGRLARLADGTADRDKWLNLHEKARLLRLERRAAHRRSFRNPGEKISRRISNMIKSARGTIENPGNNVAKKSGLNRSISQEARGRTVTMLAYKTARNGGTLHKVPAPNTSRRCSACGFITPGSREDQSTFVCKNPDCGWSGNADYNAARNVLHLYRMGHALVPAAGRAVVRRAHSVQPSTAR